MLYYVLGAFYVARTYYTAQLVSVNQSSVVLRSLTHNLSDMLQRHDRLRAPWVQQ